jgi:hypothetical protein
MSRIRFGGSVAIATLSALEALPGGGVRLSPKRSTLPDPADDVVEDGAPFRLVVHLVAEARVRTTLDARRVFERLAGGDGNEAVVYAHG